MKVIEVAVFSDWFIPTVEFKEVLENIDYGERVCFDPYVIEYIKKNKNYHAWGRCDYAIKGTPSADYKVGFAGAAYVIKVDVSKPWTIRWDNGDVPYPAYVIISSDAHNYTQVCTMPQTELKNLDVNKFYNS